MTRHYEKYELLHSVEFMLRNTVTNPKHFSLGSSGTLIIAPGENPEKVKIKLMQKAQVKKMENLFKHHNI